MHPAVADVTGDALWALMMYGVIGALLPQVHRAGRFFLTLGICWCVELSQLYQAPWIVAWRATRVGHLVLGSDFDPRDLVAYAGGALCGLFLERFWFRSGSSSE